MLISFTKVHCGIEVEILWDYIHRIELIVIKGFLTYNSLWPQMGSHKYLVSIVSGTGFSPVQRQAIGNTDTLDNPEQVAFELLWWKHFHLSAFEIVAYKMSAILTRPHCVK